MTGHRDAQAGCSSARSDSRTSSRWLLLRWFISSATFSVPQAAGPIAFSLIALSLTGEASRGAAIILAMTLAQVVGAIPVARAGRNLPVVTFLRLLVGIRTLALLLIAALAAGEAPFIWLILSAAVGGSVNGAAHGYLRSVLNHLAPASRLPRALGIAATLNELTFVLAPVAASGLGGLRGPGARGPWCRADAAGSADPLRPCGRRAPCRGFSAQRFHLALAYMCRGRWSYRCGH
jgi:MFS family permease